MEQVIIVCFFRRNYFAELYLVYICDRVISPGSL